jgi:hypothetical protein
MSVLIAGIAGALVFALLMPKMIEIEQERLRQINDPTIAVLF